MPELAELLRFANLEHRAGRLVEAEAAYRQVLAQAPREAGVRRDLAWLLHQRGNMPAAITELRQAIADAPAPAALHNDLGMMLRQAGRPADAVNSFREAVRLDPSLWQAMFNQGNAERQLGNFAAAGECFSQALRFAPNDPEVHLNLGVVQKELGQPAAAQASFERAMQLRPDNAEAWINLGTLHRAQGNVEQAVQCYRRALAISPNSAVAHNNLGLVYVSWNDLPSAIAEFEQAVRLHPRYAAAYVSLANACESWGDVERARAAFQTALSLAPDDGLRIRQALTFPVVLESTAAIESTRARLARELDALAGQDLSLVDPVQSIGAPAFALAYHGRNEREFQAKIAQTIRRATPSLGYVAEHCRAPGRPQSQPRGRIKLGFVSTHFHSHTIGKLNLGLIEQLDRDAFEVFVLRFPGHDDEMARRITAAAEHCLLVPAKLPEARAEIAAQRLDVLFYTDIGIDPFTYYLAHARLAPMQCVTWGHPLTLGIETLDYFISSHDLETATGDAHYTEKLVRLDHLANYYYRPAASTSTKTRADFGLPEDARLYACLQSLFKLHPDDDAVFAGILRRDPQARLVLLAGNFAHWTELLQARFRRSMPDVAARVLFVPSQPPNDFSRLLTVVDVLLDPLHFGGGDTSYQCFAVGAPIVTLPSQFLRGRITYALYRWLGIADLIATDVADYVDKVVRVATEPAWREELRERILAENHRIFENPAGVRDLEAFLLEAVRSEKSSA